MCIFTIKLPEIPLNLIDLASPRISWTGDYAVGNINVGVPKTDGVNPGEYATIRAVLNNGFQFADVINAMDIGLTTTYVDGPYSDWTQAEKDAYRAGAPTGLRFAMLVHSIVPNEWNQDGHGLFVTNSLTQRRYITADHQCDCRAFKHSGHRNKPAHGSSQ